MNTQAPSDKDGMDVSTRPLRESDLPAADRVMRLAFGTFIGLPDPMGFMGDADLVRTRWLADPAAAFAAEVEGELVGSNFATSWGTFGFFGPLTVRPDMWGRGVATRLMEPVMGLFERWETRQAGLFTFAQSPMHVGLYQRFGFWPRFLTAVMSKAVSPMEVGQASIESRYCELSEDERPACLDACRELTSSVYEGLDLQREIQAADSQALGDTVLLWGDGRLDGFAVCHWGPRTEAGSGACYIKFGAARLGPNAGRVFERLLDNCEALAADQGASRLVAGVSTARHDAYRQMLGRGFRTDFQGVAMHRPNQPAHCRPEVYVIDDWR